MGRGVGWVWRDPAIDRGFQRHVPVLLDLVSQGTDAAYEPVEILDSVHGKVSVIRGRVAGRQLELGGMDRNATRLEQVQRPDDELETRLRAAEMLERAARPDHVEGAQILRDVVHVDITYG